MNTLPVVCPRCGSWEMAPVLPAGLPGLRQRLRQLTGGRLYRCEGCGWRGYVGRTRLWTFWIWPLLAVAVFLALALLVLL